MRLRAFTDLACRQLSIAVIVAGLTPLAPAMAQEPPPPAEDLEHVFPARKELLALRGP